MKLNGSVRSNRKSFEKINPPFKIDHFSRLDRSHRNGPFHFFFYWQFRPILTPRTSLFGIFHAQNGGKYSSLHFHGLFTANLTVLLVQCISVYSYDRSVAALQAKCMFWLLAALKDDIIPDRICNGFFVIRFEDFERGVCGSHMANIWERSTQNPDVFTGIEGAIAKEGSSESRIHAYNFNFNILNI